MIFNENLLKGKVAVVTGGGTGIGKSIVRELAAVGAKVIICSRKKENIDSAIKRFEKEGINIDGSICDIRKEDILDGFVDDVVNKYGKIDILVNNAGGQFPSPVEHISPKGWRAVIENNLNGTFNMTLAVAKKAMIPQRGGKIINIVANMWNGFPGLAHTGAARAGVVNLTMSLSIEWAQYRILVNSIAPGTIATVGMKVYPKEVVEMARNWIPLKRYGKAEDVANAVLFLASEAGDFITGETIKIDGGESIFGSRWIIEDNDEARAESEALLNKVLEEE